MAIIPTYTTYHCNALNEHVKRLLSDSVIEQPSILSGRRTFAVRLKHQVMALFF